MAKKQTNVALEVQDRMKELTDQRVADLKKIHTKKEEAEEQKKKAEEDLADATARMDLDAYEKAKAAVHSAQTAIDMYAARYEQIRKLEMISEEESDQVIDSVKEYEARLEKDFMKAIAEPLKQLHQIVDEYKDTVAEAEQTLHMWEQYVHANYRSPGTIYAATGTDRSPVPVPIRRLPYTGCKEANSLNDFLWKNTEWWL